MTKVKMNCWGKDHWSTFAYLEVLAVDKGGIAKPKNARMRTNEKTHPHLCGNLGYSGNALCGSKYPTRLKKGVIKGHDDWDCIDDMEEEGLVKDIGTGLNRAYKLTEKGMEIAEQLRRHKMDGGVFHTFEVQEKELSKA